MSVYNELVCCVIINFIGNKMHLRLGLGDDISKSLLEDLESRSRRRPHLENLEDLWKTRSTNSFTDFFV